VRWLAVGRQALLLELEDDREVTAVYELIGALVRQGLLPRPRDVVPAARTVLVDGVPDPDSWQACLAGAERPDTESCGDGSPDSVEEVTIPVRYDGPDLDEVAAAWECSAQEVIARHSAASFTVAFCGFAPGFAYCTSDPPLPQVPRRGEPRTQVPTGSVALAGPYSGVYPRAMPGGWQLIGTTPVVLFDPGRDPVALLRPGVRVRFEAQS
jgi:allophanate hydrolase subunit 1